MTAREAVMQNRTDINPSRPRLAVALIVRLAVLTPEN